MKWFLMLLIFIAGIYYIVNQRKREVQVKEATQISQAERIRSLSDPVLPAKPDKPYVMKFSMQTIKTLRNLTQDSNEKVRFAAAELLWQLQDESAPSIIKNMFENETELPIKKMLIDMLAKDKSKLSLALLTEALKDYDRDIRLQAVQAIGKFSNKEAIPSLSLVLEDTDEEVRLRALEAVNLIRQDIEKHKEQQLRELQTKPLFRIE
jgi:HEAT repeat protein